MRLRRSRPRGAPCRCWLALVVLAPVGTPVLAGDTHIWRAIPGTRTRDYGTGRRLIRRMG